MNYSMFPQSANAIQTIYIKAASKKAFNDLLAAGDVRAMRQIEGYADGTVVKFYTKTVGGSPYAKSYGNVKNGRVK